MPHQSTNEYSITIALKVQTPAAAEEDVRERTLVNTYTTHFERANLPRFIC